MECVLQTRDLWKRYGRSEALRGVGLRVPRGAVYGLLGPNGAGKTTALKLATGLLRPTRGEVWLFGQPWRRSSLRRVGALIETPALYGNLTAEENLEVHRRLLGLERRHVREVLEQVGLTGVGRKPVSRFSLGMKQRLGIAVALLGRPELLILDEPTNGLDPIGIQEMRAMIRQLRDQGMTVLLSSHILAEVEQVVTHVGIISAGLLRYQGALGDGQNLEALFMTVVGQQGGTVDARADQR